MCCTSHRGSGDLFMCMVISFFFIPYILKNMLWTMPLSSQQLKWRSGLLSCVGFLPPPLFFGDLHYYNVVKRNTGMIYCVHPFRLVMTQKHTFLSLLNYFFMTSFHAHNKLFVKCSRTTPFLLSLCNLQLTAHIEGINIVYTNH